jgi:hypothetical protein
MEVRQMRISQDEHNEKGKLINGYDYEHQCWVKDGIIQRCGHPDPPGCWCYGKIHAGEKSINK